MCGPPDPFTLAAIAATAAGTGLQAHRSASNAVAMQKADKAAALAEMQRQQQLQNQAQGVFSTAFEDYAPQTVDQKIDAAATDRRDQATAVQQNDVGDFTGFKASAPSIVKNSIDRSREAANERSAQKADATGRVRSYGDFMRGASISDAFRGNELGQLSDFATRSANVNQYERQIAQQNADKGPMLLADLLKAGGQLGLMFAGAPAAAAGGGVSGQAATLSDMLARKAILAGRG